MSANTDDDGEVHFLLFIENLLNSNIKEFTTDNQVDNWPVTATNETFLDTIKLTHDVHQIPAYNVKGILIHPSDYENELAGDIARVCLSIVYC